MGKKIPEYSFTQRTYANGQGADDKLSPRGDAKQASNEMKPQTRSHSVKSDERGLPALEELDCPLRWPGEVLQMLCKQ
jgi:hypothetical protein